MQFPAFFDRVPVVRVRDPLAGLLGASEDGVLEYRYADAVRLAGHSCPTVAGAFLTGRAALAALYPDTLPERGGVAVDMPARADDGTTGVVAQVLTLLTGAAAEGGFRGIGGRFARNGLLRFDMPVEGAGGGVCLRRLDSGEAVAVRFDAGVVPADGRQKGRLMTILQGRADTTENAAFATAWQDRVRRILVDHADDPAMVRVTRLRPDPGGWPAPAG
ncbi:hypothetical protein [Arhodomonas aquaeolei]|uniref:hypothetical protein n=1 Tax=Arhodomonas aquaeolei TaxID=2369 RepID=UPI000379EED7|nr:hypothetical protein [Arhodomonas aquaeolei]